MVGTDEIRAPRPTDPPPRIRPPAKDRDGDRAPDRGRGSRGQRRALPDTDEGPDTPADGHIDEYV